MVTVWCVFLKKDAKNNLVKKGRAVEVGVAHGVKVDSLAKALFPKYDHEALGEVDIYLSRDYPSDEKNNDNQWTEVPGSELLQASQDDELVAREEPVKKIVYGILNSIRATTNNLDQRKDGRSETQEKTQRFNLTNVLICTPAS